MVSETFANGILADHQIRTLLEIGALSGSDPILADQIQPASLDLRLGTTAHRLRASFLPNGRRVSDCLSDGLSLHTLDLTRPAVLEVGCIYLVPLLERVRLPDTLSGRANPKSSTGRIDVFVRLITDEGRAFDDVPSGYQGPLYAEISPRTFSVIVETGERLLQLRLRAGPPSPGRALDFCVDLGRSGDIIGYRARRHSALLNLARVGQHDPRAYWDPVRAENGRLILDPDEFYILASNTPVHIPETEAAEMAPIAPDLGEFRAHYAGFFDPGFGTNDTPSRAVLEVRGRDVAFQLEHGQPVGRLVFEAMSERPDILYGASGSHYQGQGLKLSKHFAPWTQDND